MVKKIRRRVENTQADSSATTDIDLASTDQDGFVTDLERYAEDAFTRSIVEGFKVLYGLRKILAGGMVIILGVFGFAQLGELTTQDEISEQATTLERGLDALEKASGGSARTPAKTEDTPLSAEERAASSQRALGAFEQLISHPVLRDGGMAAAQFSLGKTAEAAKSFGLVGQAASDDLLLAGVALASEAAALESAGKVEEAKQAWEKLANLDKSRFGPMSAVQQARLLLAANKPAEASAVISKIETAPLSPFGLKPTVEQLQGLMPVSKK